MKKEIKVVAIVLAAIIIFLGGFGMGATKGITINVNQTGGASTPVNGGSTGGSNTPAPTPSENQTPTQDTTQAPSQDADKPANDKPADDKAPAGDSKVPSSKADVCKAYNKAINDLKAYTGKVSMQKDDDVSISVTDCSVSMLTGTVNSVAQRFIGPSSNSYVFENGKTADGSEELKWKVVPGGRECVVTEADVTEATATAAGDGYTMKLHFVSEKADMSAQPVHHMTALDPLNLATLDISPLEIQGADMTYTGADCEATVDGQGRLTKLVVHLPIDAVGQGGKGSISVSVTLGGYMDTTYTMTY